MTGKADGVTSVVGGVVKPLRMRQSDPENEQGTEQKHRQPADEASRQAERDDRYALRRHERDTLRVLKQWAEAGSIAAGLLTCGLAVRRCLPGHPVALLAPTSPLTVAGAVTVLAPDWVIRTVFPVGLLAGWHRSTANVQGVPRLGWVRQA